MFKDYLGRDIRLTQERLEHIQEHSELRGLEDRIASTVQEPLLIRRSNTDVNVLLFYHQVTGTMFGDKWLCVPVKYLETDAFILTAYLTNQPEKGEDVWTRK